MKTIDAILIAGGLALVILILIATTATFSSAVATIEPVVWPEAR